MIALYKVDSAYGEVMGSADMQLKSWRQTVGAGRVVGDFGERVRMDGPQLTINNWGVGRFFSSTRVFLFVWFVFAVQGVLYVLYRVCLAVAHARELLLRWSIAV